MTPHNTHSAQTRIACYVFGVIFLLFPFIPFYTLGFSGLAEPINSLVYIPVTILFLLSIYSIKSNSVIHQRFILPLGGLLTMLLFVLVYAQFDVTNNGVIYVTTLLFFLLIVQNLAWLKIDKKLVLYILFGFGCMQLAYGFFDYFYIIPNSEIARPSGRPEASFRQVNIYSTMMVCHYFLACYLYQTETSKRIKNIALIVAFSAPIIIYFCNSKTSFVSILVTFLLLFAVFKNRINEGNKHFLIATFIGLASTIIITVFFDASRDLSEMTNTSARVMLYKHGLTMAFEKPFLGWGPGSFLSEFYYSVIEQIKQGNYPLRDEIFFHHPHNELLLWFFELGLFGLLFICTVFVFIIKSLFINRVNRTAWGLVILCPLIMHSLLEFPIHASSLVSLYCCLIFYVFVDLEQNNTKKRVTILSTKAIIVIQQVFLPLLVIIFISSIAAAKYTSSETLADALATRSDIIVEFPSSKFIKQSDVLIKVEIARTNQDNNALKVANDELFLVIKELPISHLTRIYLDNCKILKNCSDINNQFIEAKFPQIASEEDITR